jgi:hypothetical protein
MSTLLWDLAENPLFLMLLIEFHEKHGELPEQHIDLFRAWIERVLGGQRPAPRAGLSSSNTRLEYWRWRAAPPAYPGRSSGGAARPVSRPRRSICSRQAKQCRSKADSCALLADYFRESQLAVLDKGQRWLGFT